jgi:glutathione S-transferase
VEDDVDVARSNEFVDDLLIRHQPFDELETVFAGLSAYLTVPVFQSEIVVRVEVVESDNIMTYLEKTFGKIGADESGTTRDEYLHSL